MIKQKLTTLPPAIANLKLEDWCGDIQGGNLFHRFRGTVQRTSALLNHLPTISTHINIETSALQTYTKGGIDYTIFFQMLMLYIQTVIQNLSLDNVLLPKQLAFQFSCPGCTLRIDDIRLDLEDSLPTDIPTNSTPFTYTLMQKKNFLKIPYFQCSVSAEIHKSHCGMHSHMSHVVNGIVSKIITINRRQCNERVDLTTPGLP